MTIDRNKLNLLVDALAALCLATMAGIGLLLAFVLVPGRELHATHGRGVHLTLLGWDRHQWGDLHLALSLLFVGLVVLHVALHWKQVVCMVRRLIPTRRPRIIAVGTFAGLSLFALGFALWASPELQVGGHGRGWRGGQGWHDGTSSHRSGHRAEGVPRCGRRWAATEP
ncbi:MAG: DUF4405 domain-containing protein [Deltaproteobacteria bacterium]|jgi:hypothetical protein|nr:DUF4405 domain-containing protein [Deltaproteobacteria bacterium]MBW2533561.1 DUF4405 domain-containing protein [Deltaproteobacteria bacterium]